MMPTLPKIDDKPVKFEKTVTTFNRYKSLGFDKKNKPVIEFPKFPLRLSAISLNALGDLLGEYTVWREYTEDLLVVALCEFNEQASIHDLEYAKVFLTISGKNRDERESRVLTDNKIVDSTDSRLRAEMYFNLLTTKLSSIEKSIATLSREISRRSQIPN
jgi:hypothetical protein